MTSPLAEIAADSSQLATLRRARMVLVETTHPGNIGSAARAMKTMGLRRLYLSSPRTLVDSSSRAMAAGALDILGDAVVCDDLAAAIADCAHVFALSARPRDLSPTTVSVHAAATIAAAKMAAGDEVAFVFGGERSGLSNADMRRAAYAVYIPVSGDYWSLNLAQAVQIAAYELRRAVFVGVRQRDCAARRMPTQEQLRRLMLHFGEWLRDIDMPKRGDGSLLRARLWRLLLRAQPDESETRMLRGLLTAARKKINR